MSNGPIPLIGDSWYAWGQGADGDALVLETTGLTVGGLTLFRLVPGDATAGAGRWSIMVNGDASDPQPVYILDANGAPDFLEFWIE